MKGLARLRLGFPLVFTLCCLAAMVLGAVDARAHAFRPALLSMRQAETGEIDVLWREAPDLMERATLHPIFPAHCQVRSNVPEAETGSRFLRLDCGPLGLAGQTLRVEGLKQAKVDVVWRYTAGEKTVTGLLREATPSITLPEARQHLASSWREGWIPYIGLGMLHILGGVDHLLFVLTLLLLVTKWRTLVATVSAFTAAHSITLAAGVLGWVHAPQALVEALILLSIVVVAAEAVRYDKAHPSRPWRIAFVFGLVHGFGFAGALGELGLPAASIPLALAGFNVGVEIGQLVFVAGALGLLAVARRFGAGARHRTALAYGIGGIATAWMLERISLF